MGMEIRTLHRLSRSSSLGYIPSSVTLLLTHLGSTVSEGNKLSYNSMILTVNLFKKENIIVMRFC